MTKKRWFLPTNTENLELFLSNGLMTCPSGLKDAYITDVMSDYPRGYIPFFPENNLSNAIGKAIEEDDNLTPCIIELDPSQIISMNVLSRTQSSQSETGGNYLALNISGIDEAISHKEILLQSPLPIQCIKSVFFESAKIKNEKQKFFEGDFGIYKDKLFSVGAKLFKEVQSDPGLDLYISNGYSSEAACLPDNKPDYNKIFSLGGMLGLMFYQTKNGRDSVNYFNQVCESVSRVYSQDIEAELLSSFVQNSTDQKDDCNLLYSDLLNLLSNNRGGVGEVRKEVIDYLDSINIPPELKAFVGVVSDGLKKIDDRHEDFRSPEDVFSRLDKRFKVKKQKQIIMTLVMYFFRDNTETMLKFYHGCFNQIDYVLFAMFFGIGSKYIGLPKQIKRMKGLNTYLSNRMAEYHHSAANSSEVTFKKIPSPKLVFKDFIKEKTNGESDKFIESFAQCYGLKPKSFQTWEVKHKGFSCDAKSQLVFTEKPTLIAKIDMNEIEQQVVVSTINNDKDLFDYNEVVSKYEKLVK
ncbi:MAG: hypothetical protein P1U35_12210 [Cycloclasticus sp.]|nr:hypothetical protein [Cycloclasticus sp.]